MLPLEIIVDIAKYLRYEDKVRLRRTCKFLNQMINLIYIPCKYWNRIKEMDETYFKKYIEQIYKIRYSIHITIYTLSKKLKKKILKFLKTKNINPELWIPEKMVKLENYSELYYPCTNHRYSYLISIFSYINHPKLMQLSAGSPYHLWSPCDNIFIAENY